MKKIISLILTVALVLSLSCICLAEGTGVCRSATAEQLAADLKAWGLFKGVSDKDFDLYRAPTRTEALVMLIRVLGAEEAAQSGSFSHPFTDVPAWADCYVGYGYANGLTNGVSAALFGASDVASATMYLTFMLRALGYRDSAGDFSWDAPLALAREVGLVNDLVDLEDFYRRDVVLVSYSALECRLKDSNRTLAETLSIDTERHAAAVDPQLQKLADCFGVDLLLVTIAVDTINRQLMADGFEPDYTVGNVAKREADGDFYAYLANGKGEKAFMTFVTAETVLAYQEHLSF